MAEGQTVLGVSTSPGALVRVFAGDNGRNTDDTDAHSIALVGLNSTRPASGSTDETTGTLRLLSNRRNKVVALRTGRVPYPP